jgi:hypothetical protein
LASEDPLNLQLDPVQFAAGHAAEETAAPPAPEIAPRSRDETDLQPCPYCGAHVDPDAERCGTCGERLDEEDDRPWDRRSNRLGRRDAEPHRGTLILTLGILSIICSVMWFCSPIGLVLGLTAWIMGQGDMKKLRARLMNPEGEGLTQAGWVCGIIGTILGSLCSLGLLAYIGFIATVVNTAVRQGPPRPAPTIKVAPAPPQKKAQADFVPERLRDYLPGAHC